MLEQRSEPGTYMVRELDNGARAEPLPIEVIARLRDALKCETGQNPEGDK
ncbi:hypothetical protein NONO_c62240 [Nocardia nova SH22a]|uniref:Uncharacterized protein n=1 Tax=Nocardia nova SH22a TaxID=1415166 RepID=W5TNQ4_9NOCA|nr:hypothetical protein [Nocardia nova]AHH20995.1 hypothetical protein NONO_c62240 [Nocardia nova SH22a]